MWRRSISSGSTFCGAGITLSRGGDDAGDDEVEKESLSDAKIKAASSSFVFFLDGGISRTAGRTTVICVWFIVHTQSACSLSLKLK